MYKPVILAIITMLLAIPLYAGDESTAPKKNVHLIPFASEGNVVELTVANSSARAVSGVTVTADVPSWVQLSHTDSSIDGIGPNGEALARFTFSVGKTVPVGEPAVLLFYITANGRTWTREITIEIGVPEVFELYQNYPNPFNPQTTIPYQLPSALDVTIRIYNMLGQLVETLVDESLPAGYHTVVWDGARVSSGIYVYRIEAVDDEGSRKIEQRRMLLVK